MTVRYEFDPVEMRAFSADLRRAYDALQTAGLGLLIAAGQAGTLPPEARGLVEGQCRSLGRLLAAAADGLAGGRRYLDRTAAAVERAGESSWQPTGVKVTKVGNAVVAELADRGSVKKATRADRARRWGGVLASLTGVKAVGQAVAWSDWKKALTGAKVARGTPAARAFAATLDRRAVDGVRANAGFDRRRLPSTPGDSGLRRLGRTAVGAAPWAGDVADGMQYLADGEKLRRQEPQTGLAQAATDTRDFVALVGSSNHLAADVFSKHPVTLPAALINETVGYGADGVVLALDGANEVRKGADAAIDRIGDGFRSLVRPPW